MPEESEGLAPIIPSRLVTGDDKAAAALARESGSNSRRNRRLSARSPGTRGVRQLRWRRPNRGMTDDGDGHGLEYPWTPSALPWGYRHDQE